MGSMTQDSSWMVIALMGVLVLMSVVSWAIIISHLWLFSNLKRQYKSFEKTFWSGVDLSHFYEQTKRNKVQSPIEEIFLAGFSGLTMQQSSSVSSNDGRLEQCKSMMALSQRKWEVGVHGQLTWLATIASVSPYIGLLGTVFGVMHTFQGILYSQSQAQLAAVAPGISEALGMTAFGLFVAIPATVAYNRLSLQMGTVLEYYQIFYIKFYLIYFLNYCI